MQVYDPYLMKEKNSLMNYENLLGYMDGDGDYNGKEQEVREISINQIQLIEIIHDYLVYWFKIRGFRYKFNGRSVDRPVYEAEEINKFLENTEFQHERRMFYKRHGYLNSASSRRQGNRSIEPSGFSPTKTNKKNPNVIKYN